VRSVNISIEYFSLQQDTMAHGKLEIIEGPGEILWSWGTYKTILIYWQHFGG